MPKNNASTLTLGIPEKARYIIIVDAKCVMGTIEAQI
jgi:hypothetical protein